MEEKKTSQEWFDTLCVPRGTVILDPDGWDRTNFAFSWNEELISKDEFTLRLCDSTCMFDKTKWSLGNNNE
jgi:hypothetical protein